MSFLASSVWLTRTGFAMLWRSVVVPQSKIFPSGRTTKEAFAMMDFIWEMEHQFVDILENFPRFWVSVFWLCHHNRIILKLIWLSNRSKSYLICPNRKDVWIRIHRCNRFKILSIDSKRNKPNVFVWNESCVCNSSFSRIHNRWWNQHIYGKRFIEFAHSTTELFQSFRKADTYVDWSFWDQTNETKQREEDQPYLRLRWCIGFSIYFRIKIFIQSPHISCPWATSKFIRWLRILAKIPCSIFCKYQNHLELRVRSALQNPFHKECKIAQKIYGRFVGLLCAHESGNK